MSSQNQCTGSITFNEVSSGAITEWPSNLPGYICKTPPVGPNSDPRLPHCCSGPVYNITTPTTPDDPAYPMTCATLCQVDPALDEKNEDNPYGWSDFFMCLIDGGRLTSDTETVCGWVDAENGEPAPSSFASTPTWPAWTSYWTSVVYSTDDSDHSTFLEPLTHWVALSDLGSGAGGTTSTQATETSAGSGSSGASTTTTASATPTPHETELDSSTAEDSESPSTTSAPATSSRSMEEGPTPTTSRGTNLGVDRLVIGIAVFSLLSAGLCHI
ncbi:hypothetical protein BJY01DRAFT_214169 [Aspergillus pseudoustus]|uniref:Extracellular membrane protein CFEM domain-containing protein n=1 Tax=Aspergillus pseudoustus TaxID=1810923 RepID=A0ABR4K118_9EURO